MYGRVIYSDQRLFINNLEVNGVQSCSTSFDVPVSPIFIAGVGPYSQEVGSQLEGSVEVERLIVQSDDFLTSLLGRSVSGCLAYKRSDESTYRTNAFLDARIKSYSIECSVGQIAKSNFSMSVYGNMGAGIAETGAENPYSVMIAKPGDLTISLPDVSTNRVQSINYEVSIPYSRNSFIGGITGSGQVLQNEGVTIDVTVGFDADDIESPRFFDQLCADGVNINFRFENCSGDVVRSFSAPNARFVGTSMSAGIGENMSVDFKYQSVLANTSSLATYLSSEIAEEVIVPPFSIPCETIKVEGSSNGDGVYLYSGQGLDSIFVWERTDGIDPFLLFGNTGDWTLSYSLDGSPEKLNNAYSMTGDWGDGVMVTCFAGYTSGQCIELSVANSPYSYNGDYGFYENGPYGLAWTGGANYIWGVEGDWKMGDYYGVGGDHFSSNSGVVGSWSDGVTVTCR